jgi:beta-glucosidase
MDDDTAYLTATPENWRPLAENTNTHAPVITLESGSKLAIPLLVGIDAVHGMHEVLGNIVFPHNIGLSATHDPALLAQVGHVTAEQLLKQGFNWTYAPTVAISHNPNWGRSFETLGSDPNNAYQLAYAMVSGLQQNSGTDLGAHGVLATVKHFIGDGATYNGIDQGDTHVDDFDRFFAVNAAGYRGAVDADAASLMVSYSAINNTPMSINASLLAKLRSGELTGKPYTGLIVSDYGAIANLTRGLPTTTDTWDYPDALAKAVNAGIDLIMISNAASYKTLANFMDIFKQVVTAGQIDEQRIDQAVTHILAVKYAMGLIRQDGDGAWRHQFKTLDEPYLSIEQQQDIALQAAERSLVLLKNEQQVLPTSKDNVKYIVLIGDDELDVRHDGGDYDYQLVSNYDNIGARLAAGQSHGKGSRVIPCGGEITRNRLEPRRSLTG